MKFLQKLKARTERASTFVRTGLLWPAVTRRLKKQQRLPPKPQLGAEFVPPFMSFGQHSCFGCSPVHASGLKLRFFRADGWTLATSWQASAGYENYPGMIHGGIVATILDELAGQAVFLKLGYLPVSLKVNLEWMKATKVGMLLTASARVISRHDNFARVEAFIFRDDGKAVAKLTGLYFTPTLKTFRKITGISAVPPEVESWFAPHRR